MVSWDKCPGGPLTTATEQRARPAGAPPPDIWGERPKKREQVYEPRGGTPPGILTVNVCGCPSDTLVRPCSHLPRPTLPATSLSRHGLLFGPQNIIHMRCHYRAQTDGGHSTHMCGATSS